MFKNKNNLLDAHLVSDFIGAIYQASLEGNWHNLIERLRDATRSNKALFFLQKLDEPAPIKFEFITNFQHCPNALEEYQRRTLEDPYLAVSQRIAEGDSININEHLDITSIVGTEYYQRILLPLKSHYVMGGCLIRDGIHESIYAINRGPEDPPYSESEYAFIKLITPHFSRAVQMYKDLKLYKSYSTLTKSILDQSDKGVLVCDANNKILILNAFAENELAAWPEFALVDRKLILTNPVFNHRLKQCIAQCIFATSTSFVPEPILITSEYGESVLISVSPLRQDARLVDFDQPCCLITLCKQSAVNWAMLQKEYSLTRKELELVQALNRKKKLQDLTVEMDVSYNTLATHLKAIYKKMGIHSQAELMVMIGLFR